ncbi:hypothetical protein AVEN_256692-1 [Araneus ventricosus]|uniref:Histone-lysine N-methyltransferase SETMAR n=1 Tax=Araneus ventricosus TaxID=182803 RepID=A0A4Y2EGG9_ARAVE|nr:hypothetical protein AVEN_256692-1 [Araneus ventricosus]
MCEGKVHKWARDFKAGRDNGHDDSRSGRPSVIGLFWLGRPPYSTDLAPSNFHLFRHLKHNLSGNHYNEDKNMKTAVTSWLSEQAASVYEEGIQNLVVRYDKCLNKLGSFVEKQRNVCRI